MYKLARPFFMICETPLHAGSGSDLGVIDLPIQRERHTGFPKVEASGIKGCIRSSFEQLSTIKLKDKNITDNKSVVDLAFGPENGNEHAGALGFTDARTLLFPVKSMKGVFAWVTCPKVLARFKNDLELCEIHLDFQVPQAGSTARNSSLLVKENKIVLEEYTFEIIHKDDENCTKLAEWMASNIMPGGEEYQYNRKKIKKDIVVLSDDDFRDFVNLSTEVVTRTRIDSEKGTVAKGALFTEEYLPAETLLYSLALASPIFSEVKEHKELFDQKEKSVMEFFLNNKPKVIQLGGNATIGKGIVRVVCCNEK